MLRFSALDTCRKIFSQLSSCERRPNADYNHPRTKVRADEADHRLVNHHMGDLIANAKDKAPVRDGCKDYKCLA